MLAASIVVSYFIQAAIDVSLAAWKRLTCCDSGMPQQWHRYDWSLQVSKGIVATSQESQEGCSDACMLLQAPASRLQNCQRTSTLLTRSP